MTPPTTDPLRDYLKHLGLASIPLQVTAGSYRRWLEDPESFLAHDAARSAATAPPKRLTLTSHSPEAAAAVRAERDQKKKLEAQARENAARRGEPVVRPQFRAADGSPLTMQNMGDTEHARALRLGAQQERETKERLRRQAAENAARRAAAEADARDATPA